MSNNAPESKNSNKATDFSRLEWAHAILGVLMSALALGVLFWIARDDPISGIVLADILIYLILNIIFIAAALLLLWVIFQENLNHVSISRWTPMTIIFVLYLIVAVRMGSFAIDAASATLRSLISS